MPAHRLPRSSALPLLSRVAVAVFSVAVLFSTGFAWAKVHDALGGITISDALDDADGSTEGVTILLIGLDSRKDANGDDLPQEVLDNLHAGSSDDGGYNTNTLILMHIAPGADGERSVAFSIPRDDLVPFTGVPGYHRIKIKEAYGLTKAHVAEQLVEQGVDDPRQVETRSREAARRATLKAVRELTGAPVDLFAEVNLAGFYDLAENLGGVQVCLNHAVYDEYSGADFPAGRQTLDGAQALAFVRQRHGLDNGDLDRTRRQQAFLVSVLRRLNDAGTFTDMSKLDGLMDVVHKDVVLSHGWDVNAFKRIQTLAGGGVEFRTLPILGYDTVNGQDVNIVDRDAIRAEVAQAFGLAAPATTASSSISTSVVEETEPYLSDTAADATVTTETSPDVGPPITAASGVPCVN
ncbi:LCP family protein [Mycolicibacterium brumae]|uniref:LytR family transcriptional regulator n=1 Tax=Mycolicibacterium brumae TaxID=85968 RepID=A0A2G5P525_9MYCO|nr:LCP family protein [Mycolicibacterium brumae]MCV7191352.1 LCP family protein [Mycolicibacterium brumae]PIB73395.1 LytR family transcriptional regulator [Mycolicibacterium brumae]RWA18195.1 hypothetical protein MBRU_17810 [Mycolicibacterium brumae DSM 44177]